MSVQIVVDPAVSILRHRKQEAGWLAERTGGRIDRGRINRVGRGESTWSALERASIAEAFDLPEDVLWPERQRAKDGAA